MNPSTPGNPANPVNPGHPSPSPSASAAPAPASKPYTPSLALYHPNSKGTGCAIQFDLRPATADREGCLFVAFANQKSLATGSRTDSNRQAATFNWSEKITVKLNFSDVSHLLLVLCGKANSIADGKGLFHDSGETTTIIQMARQTEPVRGTAFEVSKKRRNSPDQAQRSRILLTDAETFGLARLLDATLYPLAFGR